MFFYYSSNALSPSIFHILKNTFNQKRNIIFFDTPHYILLPVAKIQLGKYIIMV